MASAEEQLNNLLQKLLDEGVEVLDPRTGESTLALFDSKIVIEEGVFPFFTDTLAHPRLAFEEMWFFLNGKTQTKELEAKGVNFWKGNTSKEFQETVGLGYLEEGDIGAAYSSQWRNSGGYGWEHEGKDQLAELLYSLNIDKYSRRHYVTLWNPVENEFGVLTPCWHSCQFVVLPDRHGNDVLNLKLVNRSLDVLFGARYALMQYRMLQMVLCRMFGFKLGKLSADLTQYHLYDNQIEYAKELLERDFDSGECYIKLKDDVDLGDMYNLLGIEWEDWELVYSYNKTPYKTPRPAMVA